MHDIASVPSNVQSASCEALLYVFEDNEAVIKMIMKGRSPTMRHVPELIELLLIGCSIELILIQRSKSNSSTLRTDWQTSWQRGISHAMNGIICWPCLILAILALLLASQRWRKRAQQESGDGRVTAKSRPMMNLTARTPSFVSSSASSNPGRTSYGYQDPEKTCSWR